ncbi:MAG: hypothetical protein QOE45_1811 [Frankiaceae bacterium]|nr:hypothetical protein [Frankiaceae bacterium]
MSAEHLALLLGGAVPAEVGTPFLTFYDDATGERSELSYATADNWVAKTANFLRDGLDVTPGDTVTVDLPPHWQAVVVTLAVWVAGAVVGDGEVAFVAEESLPRNGFREVVGLSLRPMAARLSGAYPGVLDFAEEVPGYGDRFAASGPATAPRAEPRPGRVLVADADPVPAALAALAGGGGVVIVRNADPALLAHRAEIERVADR